MESESFINTSPMSNENDPPITAAEQAQLQHRFPHLGYWTGMLPDHPRIYQQQQQFSGAAQYYQQWFHNAAQALPPLHNIDPRYQPPSGPPPGYAGPPLNPQAAPTSDQQAQQRQGNG